MGLTLTAYQSLAQETPAPSPKSVVEQKIGLVDFKVVYSRPSVKDREIFGKLVPYDTFWRTGANASTKVSISKEIKIGGKPVPAGEYALYTIPGKDSWTVILSNNDQLPGKDGYKTEDDQVRFEVAPTQLKQQVESFTIGFDRLRDDSATMFLDWDMTRIAFDIELDTKAQVLASIKEVMNSGEELNGGNYARSASAYLSYEVNLEQALVWIQKAVEMQEGAFWLINTEAQIHAKLGNKKEAIASAKKSIEVAKANDGGDFGYIKLNEELIKSLK